MTIVVSPIFDVVVAMVICIIYDKACTGFQNARTMKHDQSGCPSQIA